MVYYFMNSLFLICFIKNNHASHTIQLERTRFNYKIQY